MLDEWDKYGCYIIFCQMAPRDCQALAGSLLGFIATRADTPLVTVHVFSNIFHKFTNLNGEQIFLFVAISTAMYILCYGIYLIITSNAFCLSVYNKAALIEAHQGCTLVICIYFL